MNRYTDTNVWNDPRSYAPDPLRRKNWFNRIISGDCFYLVSGALVALDFCLVIWLVRR